MDVVSMTSQLTSGHPVLAPQPVAPQPAAPLLRTEAPRAEAPRATTLASFPFKQQRYTSTTCGYNETNLKLINTTNHYQESNIYHISTSNSIIRYIITKDISKNLKIIKKF